MEPQWNLEVSGIPILAKRVDPLTSAKIRSLKPGNTTTELVDGHVPGLRVRMTPNGVKTWSLNIRDAKGQRRRFDVGRDLGLREARDRASEIRQQVRSGADPTAERRASKLRSEAAKSGTGTFGSVVADYFASGNGSLLHSRAEQKRRIRNVFAKHLGRPAVEISPAEFQIAADKHSSASSAGHAVAYVRPLAAWASRRGLMQRGFTDLEKPAARSEANDTAIGQRFLTQDELAKILPALGSRGHNAAARFMLLTACRLEEACGATWAEIDLEHGSWTIPASRRKDTRSKLRVKQVPPIDHAVILPRQAIELLSRSLEPAEPDVLVFRGERGAKLQNWDRWTKLISAETGITGWDRHALRRTTATMAGDLDAPPHVISAMLGHRNIGSQLTAGYSKARYGEEVGRHLQLVADRLQAIESGEFAGSYLHQPTP